MKADAVVVGAGVAGLSAATALTERGWRVLVLEARPTLGGRATAFTDPATGERVDNGPHILLGCYHDTFRFLRRIGSAGHVPVQRRLSLDFVDRAGQASRLVCPGLRPPFNLLAGLMMWRALNWRDRLSALRISRAVSETDRGGEVAGRAPAAASQETVREWLSRHRQTPRVIDMLWEPLVVAALNQSIDVAAAAPFARVLAEMLGRHPSDAALAVPSGPLDEVYATPARTFIEKHGGEVRTNAPARILTGTSSAGRVGVAVTVRGEEWRAPFVISAVPWFALSEVFVGRPSFLGGTLDAADRTASSSIVTVNLWLDREVTEHTLIGLPGRTLQWVFDKRKVFGERAAHLSLVGSGADAVVSLTNDELIAIAVAELREAIPAARPADVRRAIVVREKRATFSVAPGQPPRPKTRTAVRGLLLAGDWIDTGLPATIESAARSGHLAAAAAMDDL